MDNNTNGTNNPTPTPNSNNRLYNIVAYINILWIIGLIAAPTDPEVRFHVNQGIVLSIFEAAIFILAMIPILGWFVIGPVGAVMSLILTIIGIVNAVNDQQKELPVIGKIRIVK